VVGELNSRPHFYVEPQTLKSTSTGEFLHESVQRPNLLQMRRLRLGQNQLKRGKTQREVAVKARKSCVMLIGVSCGDHVRT
jgi:hypothetical protein